MRRIGRQASLAGLVLALGLLGGAAQNLPDLQITSPFMVQPGEIEQGGVVSIRAMVTNNETGAVPASFDVKFQLFREDTGEVRDLSADEILCVNAPKEGDPSRCVVPPLAPVGKTGDSFEARAQLDTTGLSPASYTLKAIADPENVVQEANEDNNEGEGFLIVLPRKPNLSILAEFRLEPASPRQGDLLTVEFTVENDRQAGIAAPIPISVGLRNRADLERGQAEFAELIPPAIRCPGLTIVTTPQGLPRCALGDGLPGNTRRTVTLQIVTTLIEPGEYQLRLTVDPENDIDTEADEEDNVLTLDFTLRPPPRNLSLGEGRVLPSAALPGDLVTLAFAVFNLSSVAVDGVALGFALRRGETGEITDLRTLPGFACGPRDDFDPQEDRCSALRVEAGGALEVLAQFSTEGLPLGPYEAIVTVDPQDVIEETNETDNTLQLTFSLVEKPPVTEAGPELHPIGITFTPNSPIPQEQQVLVNATIENTGNRDAGPFRVEFSLRREDGGSQSQSTFTTFGVQIVSELRLGKTVDVQSVLETAELEPGVYAVRVRITGADPSELDPNNNALIAFLTITKPPGEGVP